MPQFRKKPVVIEAVQLTSEIIAANLLDEQPLPRGMKVGRASYDWTNRTIGHASFFVFLASGEERQIITGEWMLRDEHDDLYIMSDKEFKESYEPA